MEKHVDRPNGHLGKYPPGPAYTPGITLGQATTRFDLDAAWQRLLQLPLGLLGILAISLLLLAISLPQSTNATAPGPVATVTPTVTPSPTVSPEAAGPDTPAAADCYHCSSSFSSDPPAGGDSVAGRAGGPNAIPRALHATQPGRPFPAATQ